METLEICEVNIILLRARANSGIKYVNFKFMKSPSEHHDVYKS